MDDFAAIIAALHFNGDMGLALVTEQDRIISYSEAGTAITALLAERNEHDGIVAVWRRRTDEAEAERDAALERERVLREALIASREFLKHAPLESGYCCCGDKIETHNIGSGHSPVDMLQHGVEQEIQRVSAALSASGKQEVCGG